MTRSVKKRRPRPRHSHGGFTMMEVVIGALVLIVILVGLNTVFLSFVKTNKTNRDIGGATSVGNKWLEEVRMMPFDSISGGSVNVGTRYCRSTTVTTDSATTKKTVAVIVSWPQTAGSHHVTMNTIIAKP